MTPITEFLIRKLTKLNAERSVKIPTSEGYVKRVERAIKSHNDNLSKCGVFINDQEFSADEINKLKIAMPNFNPVVRYESTASDGSKFLLEVI